MSEVYRGICPNSKNIDFRFLKSQEIFAHGDEVKIFHRGDVYRLKLTKNNKLILNK